MPDIAMPRTDARLPWKVIPSVSIDQVAGLGVSAFKIDNPHVVALIPVQDRTYDVDPESVQKTPAGPVVGARCTAREMTDREKGARDAVIAEIISAQGAKRQALIDARGGEKGVWLESLTAYALDRGF